MEYAAYFLVLDEPEYNIKNIGGSVLLVMKSAYDKKVKDSIKEIINDVEKAPLYINDPFISHFVSYVLYNT